MRKDCRRLIHEVLRDIGRKAGERGGNLLSGYSIPNDFEQIITKLSIISRKENAERCKFFLTLGK